MYPFSRNLGGGSTLTAITFITENGATSQLKGNDPKSAPMLVLPGLGTVWSPRPVPPHVYTLTRAAGRFPGRLSLRRVGRTPHEHNADVAPGQAPENRRTTIGDV